MTSFLDPLIAFVSAHPGLAYLTVFLAALLEAVPVVGGVIPGSTIILALSGLIPGGELRLIGQAQPESGIDAVLFGISTIWMRADLDSHATDAPETLQGPLDLQSMQPTQMTSK